MAWKYLPFLNCKATEIDWLKTIPTHWDERPLKYLSNIDNSGCYGSDPEGYEITAPVATTAQISSEGKFDMNAMPIRGFGSEEFDRYRCDDGQILVVKSSGSATNIISGKAGIVTKNEEGFVFSNFLLRIIPDENKVLPRFLYALLISNLTRERIKLMCSTTTYPNLSVPEYSSSLLPVPPLPEQGKIIGFLDQETAKIDTLIGKQQQLIKLLKEKRHAVISHAISKGLNPDAPMKNSGVEWLGEVPEHWEEVRVKRLYEFAKRQGYEDLTVLSVYREHGVIVKSTRDDNFNKTPDNLSVYQLVNEGDLVINKMKAWQGSMGISQHQGITSPDYAVYRPLRDFDDRYLHYWFRASHMPDVYRNISTGIRPSQWRLDLEEFEKLKVYLPPSTERSTIVSEINAIEMKYLRLVELAEKQIDLLQERRTALISAAVTGKIDVRSWKIDFESY